MVLALVVLGCFKNQLLSLFVYHNLDILVIIYLFDVIHPLGIYLLGYIYYSPIFIILRGEIQRRKR
jgi:hypothetical protein